MRKEALKVVILGMVVLLMGSLAPLYAAEQPYAGTTIRIMQQSNATQEIWNKAAQLVADEMGIELITTWYGWADSLNKQIMDINVGATEWDIVTSNTPELAMFVEKGTYTPIEDFINSDIADPDWDVDDFYSLAVEPARYKGKIWAMAPNISIAAGLFYRKDLFNHPEEKKAFREKYGYELRIPTDELEYRDVAEFFTRRSGEKLAGEVLDDNFYGTVISGRAGGFAFHDFVIYSATSAASLIEFASPRSLHAMEYLRSLEAFMPPEASVMSSGECVAAFADGRIAMWREFVHFPPVTLADAEKSPKIQGKWGIAPQLTTSINRPYATHADLELLAIWALSKNKEAAFKLWEKVNSKEMHKWMALNYGYISSRRSVLEDPEVQAAYPWMKDLADILARPIFFTHEPKIPEFQQFKDVIGEAVNEALVSDRPVIEIFSEAQARIDKVLSDYNLEELVEAMDTEYIYPLR